MVEFALVLPLLLAAMLGILDFGRVIFAYNSVSNAARTATRAAIVDQTQASIDSAVADEAVGLAPLSVIVTYPGCAQVKLNCIVRVEVSHDWTPITPLIGALTGPITVASSSEMPVERVHVGP